MSDENDSTEKLSRFRLFFDEAKETFSWADKKLNDFFGLFDPGVFNQVNKVEGPSTDSSWTKKYVEERDKIVPPDPLRPKQEENEKSVVNAVLGFDDVRLSDFNDSFGAAFTFGSTTAAFATIIANNSKDYTRKYSDTTVRFFKAQRTGLLVGIFFGCLVYLDYEFCNKAICDKYFKQLAN